MDTVSKELRGVRRKADTRTGVIREVPFTKMHECTLRIDLNERVKCLRDITTHPTDATAPYPHQIIGDVKDVRAIPPTHNRKSIKIENPNHGQEL